MHKLLLTLNKKEELGETRLLAQKTLFWNGK
jgi:hypothetical protein